MVDGARSPIDLLAWGISYVVNPLILPPILFGWLGFGLGLPREMTLAMVGISALFLGILPLVIVAWMVRRGDAETLEVRDRAKRLPAFLWAMGFGAAAVVLALITFESTLPAALLAVFPVNLAMLTVINRRTKISVHSASIAGLASMTLWLGVVAALPLALPIAALAATPVVMWARVRTEAHSGRQVILGAAFGIVVPVLELYLMAGLDWLGLPL